MKKLLRTLLLSLFCIPVLGACDSGPTEITLNSTNYDVFLEINAKDRVLGSKHELSASCKSKDPSFKFSGSLLYAEIQIQYYYKNNNDEVGKNSYCNFTITLDSSGNGSSTAKKSSGITSVTCDELTIISAEPLSGKISGQVTVQGGDKSKYQLPDHRVTFKNYDGTFLDEVTVKHGGTATYSGPTPTKPSYQYTDYVFSGWGYGLNNIERSMTLIAHYSEEQNKNDPAYTNGEFLWKEVEGGYEIQKYITVGSVEELILPSTYNGLPVLSIGEKAFYDRTDITYIKFGTNLVEIKESAFCTNRIKQLNFPSSLRIIGNNAFKTSYNLRSITLNDGLQEIGEYAFDGVVNKSISSTITSIRIPSTVTSIGKMAFYDEDCKTLGVLNLYCGTSSKPNGWNSLWNLAFGYYSSTYSSDYTYHNVYWNS